MFNRSGITKTNRAALTIVCFVVAFLLIQSNMAFGGGWSASWKKEKQATNAVGIEKQTVTDTIEGIVPGEDEQTATDITDIKVAYVFYFKVGKIWLVDTTTLVKKQLSTESGIYPDTLCEVQRFENWQNPNGSTIYYRLKGPDVQCYTGDDIVRAVKVGMTPTTPPINIPKKEI